SPPPPAPSTPQPRAMARSESASSSLFIVWVVASWGTYGVSWYAHDCWTRTGWLLSEVLCGQARTPGRPRPRRSTGRLEVVDEDDARVGGVDLETGCRAAHRVLGVDVVERRDGGLLHELDLHRPVKLGAGRGVGGDQRLHLVDLVVQGRVGVVRQVVVRRL